jgi:hypothetical protein
LAGYFDTDKFIDHSPEAEDGVSALRTRLSAMTPNGDFIVRYDKVHRLLAEGDVMLLPVALCRQEQPS